MNEEFWTLSTDGFFPEDIKYVTKDTLGRITLTCRKPEKAIKLRSREEAIAFLKEYETKKIHKRDMRICHVEILNRLTRIGF